MTNVVWSRCRDEDCIRIEGLPAAADLRVRPRTDDLCGELPAMAGTLVRDGVDACFIPRFPFVEDITYTIAVDGLALATLHRHRPDRPTTTEVLDVHPTAIELPRNMLRFYVTFSAPMSEGYAGDHVRLVDEDGLVISAAFLPSDAELWDRTRRRLTLLLDPARIKRGLVPHRQAGYPLQKGTSFRLVVDGGFRDASGTPLRAGSERWYRVGEDQRRHVDPADWVLCVPPGRTLEPLEVRFDRSLDHGLLGRCLRVLGPDGRRVVGSPEIGSEERSWRLAPRAPWAPGPHQLVVDPVLEDLAGNSVSRLFDRDLTETSEQPRRDQPVKVAFLTQ